MSFSPSRQSDSEEEVGGKNLKKNKMGGNSKNQDGSKNLKTEIFSQPLFESKNAWGFRSSLSCELLIFAWSCHVSSFVAFFGNVLY